jgi:hypothetical protein
MNITDRTPAHAANELSAAAAGFPYPEPTRTLRFNFGGIRYEIFDAILSWSAPDDDILHCDRCGQDLTVLAPNLLHNVPLASCRCRGCYMQPVDDRDHALLALAHPISEQDKALGERFHHEIARLTTVSPEARR